MDQNPPPNSSVSKKQEAIKGLRSDLQLIDVWRTLHPGEKDYTFYSNPHKSFSRIDYFLVSREVNRVGICDTGTRILSADVHLKISPPEAHPTLRSWRSNPSLLNNSMFRSYIKEQVDLFLRTNDNKLKSFCPLGDNEGILTWRYNFIQYSEKERIFKTSNGPGKKNEQI